MKYLSAITVLATVIAVSQAVRVNPRQISRVHDEETSVHTHKSLADGPVRSTEAGPVRGYTSESVNIFKGIPFAKPPVGDLRFKSPEPPVPWDNPYDATYTRSVCPQFKQDFVMWGSEDCLYLNVYTPEGANSSEPLPVMVWFYGGAYIFGDGYELGWYDGRNLARKRNMVIVTFNYRLAAFGFLGLEALRNEDPNKSTGNYGVQDQVQALQWVQKNIHNFGGDPKQVTIFGQSAGGFSVCWHMVNPSSAGLFRAAIMESGSCDAKEFFQTMDAAENFAQIYADAAGCNKTKLGTDAAFLSCLRSLTAEQLMENLSNLINDPNYPFPPNATATQTANPSMWQWLAQYGRQYTTSSATPPYSKDWTPLAPLFPFGPVIDGSPAGLVDLPLNSILAGNFNKVPIILGTTENEGTLFVFTMPIVVKNGVTIPMTDEMVTTCLEHFYNASQIPSILAYYPKDSYKDPEERLAYILRDQFFTCGARRAARAFVEGGVPAYLYQFTYPLRWIDGKLLGDYHTSELYFVWDNEWPPVVHPFNDVDKGVANVMGGYWGNMAYTMTPNGGKFSTPTNWTSWDNTTQAHMNINSPSPQIENHLAEDVCNFLDQLQCPKCGK